MKFIMDNKWYLIAHELDYCVLDEDSLIKTIIPKFEALFYRHRDRFEYYASMLELIKRNEFIRFLTVLSVVEKEDNASSHGYYTKWKSKRAFKRRLNV